MKKQNLLLVFTILTSLFAAVPALALPTQGAGLSRTTLESFEHQASFTEDWARYPSPDVIVGTLQRNFPWARAGKVGRECLVLTSTNRSLLGDSEPLTGAPSVDHPNSTFINWYTNCLTAYIKAEDEALSIATITSSDGGSTTTQMANRKIEEYRQFFTAPVITECAKNDDPLGAFKDPSGTVEASRFTCRWTSLSNETRESLARMLIEKYIGPEEVLADLGIAESEDKLIATVLNEVAAFATAPDNRFEFLEVPAHGGLSVRNASKIIRFLINLEDTLKY